jgi:hypothetical protein
MNVNTYDATPLLDEVISVRLPDRMFRDGTDVCPLWFEFQPDRFWCGNDLREALNSYRHMPKAGLSLQTLSHEYPSGYLVGG